MGLIMSKVLYEELESGIEFLKQRGYWRSELSNAISDNIKQPLRKYQIRALENFIFYCEDKQYSQTQNKHLLFHMATGSGKTNLIAASILYLYERGYRDFIFFVNTTNIITKTKENIINRYSAKYLFSDKIIINAKEVNINEITDTFDVSKRDDINIMFTTTHKLHGDLETTIKENSITYADFENKKIVLIADEAHHLNSELKKSKNKEDEANLKSWGMTTKKLLQTHKENLLLEFTATAEINSSKEIAEHYKDKIIAEYPLKLFREDKYSKDIKLINDNFTPAQRMLQAMMVSEYRKIVAREHLDRVIKPVVMFKNPKGIAKIDASFSEFTKLVQNLRVEDVEEVFQLSDINAIQDLQKHLVEDEKDLSAFTLGLQRAFSSEHCLVIYSTSADKEEKLKLLNSLENLENPIRVIFAVNVLNEGWDVLNLFDIVKLDEAKSGAKNTTSEAQLIGRGARYFPFEYKDEEKYKRKFDSDFTNPLRYLEEVYFYSINKSEYISSLKKELSKIGLMDEEEELKEVTLRLKESFLNDELYKSGFVYVNAKVPQDKTQINSLSDYIKPSYKIQNISIDNSSNEIKIFDEEVQELKFLDTKSFEINSIDNDIVRVAINKKPFFYFSSLKKYFKNLRSISEFIVDENFLGGVEFFVKFTKEQEIDEKLQIKLIGELLDILEKEIKKNATDFVGSSEFYPVRISDKILKSKTLKLKDIENKWIDQDDKDWYVFERHQGTSEEISFVMDFMVTIVNDLKAKYRDIKLIRNEKAFEIYSFDKRRNGQKFEPDFLLLLQDEKCFYQIFCEPKGDWTKDSVEGFENSSEKWKNEFLNAITQFTNEEKIKLQDINEEKLELYENSCYKLYGLPFYNQEMEGEFREEFKAILL